MITIIEGPDGSGKSSLASDLHRFSGAQILERHVKSNDGPRPDLFSWTENDIQSWSNFPQGDRIYDRHPLIGEYIYGPILRGEINPNFMSYKAQLLRMYFYAHAKIIICLPSFSVVEQNVMTTPQMPGVVENIDQIYMAYARLLESIPMAIGYDYTRLGAEESE